MVSEKTVAHKRQSEPSPATYRTRGPIKGLINLVVWVVGILVSLAVGFGMISEVLTVPFIHSAITQFAGWVVVILAILVIILKIIEIADR